MHVNKDVVQADELVKRRTLYGVRPKKAGAVVNQLLTRHGIAQQQHNQQLRSNWDTAVGTKWNQLSLAGNISRGVLEVTVANSLVNQQLTFEKKKLLTTMQKLMPEAKLKDLRFRVGNVNR